MAATPYTRGDVARITAAFTVGGTTTPAIPATVVARVLNGHGSPVATYVYGAGQLVATGSGAYQVDQLLDTAGDWRVRVEGLGSNQAAEEFQLHVRPSAFDG